MKKVIVIIRDGWGYGENNDGNAIFKANTPNHDKFVNDYPTTMLKCKGRDVGNPEGVMGGSEVGHLTIGAGRIVWQPYELINREIKSGAFYKNKELLSAINNCKENNSDLHLNGLFSSKGIHADYKHMFDVLKLCKMENFDRVFIHLCLDGRDMPEKSAIPLIQETEEVLKDLGIGRIASVIGRFYCMDRDQNWDRTLKAYNLMVSGEGEKVKSAQEAVEHAYESGTKTDYYVEPYVISNDNNPIVLLKDNDSFIWYNFRSDRSRQITAMINNLDYCTKKPDKIINVHYICFSSYDSDWQIPVAFQQQKVNNVLGQVISEKGLKQLRAAETEKYAHITFFFNAQREQPFKGEERILVHSPKVASYDLKPEMSAYELTEKVLPEIGKFDLIILNFANADLVGHSGIFSAVVKSCEVVDECVGKIVSKCLDKEYYTILMADHGNADHMLYDNGEVDPSHGFNPVLVTVISNDEKIKKSSLRKGGGHQDIAPTVLNLMDIDKPSEMTGKSLL